MKIELKINPDAIMVLSALLSGVYASNPQIKLEKVIKCVLMDVYDKVQNKEKDLQRKQSLFDAKKKVTLSLKYSQAFYLSHFLMNLPAIENDFQKSQVIKLINLIDQKLC